MFDYTKFAINVQGLIKMAIKLKHVYKDKEMQLKELTAVGSIDYSRIRARTGGTSSSVEKIVIKRQKLNLEKAIAFNDWLAIELAISEHTAALDIDSQIYVVELMNGRKLQDIAQKYNKSYDALRHIVSKIYDELNKSMFANA